MIDGIELPAPPIANSLEYGLPDKGADYLLRIFSGEYADVERTVEIFSGIKTIQPIAVSLKPERRI